jgi:exonuclease SbcD
MLIPINNADGKPGLIVAAVPFLRDADLRKHSENETSEDRAEAVKTGIIRIFNFAAEQCKKLYPEIPAIALGHLYVQGAGLSESEREIQLGNIAGIEEEKLSGYFHYYALGHLHKPQQPGNNDKIIYSGAPVKMSFSESENENRVMQLTIEGNELKATSIPVPLKRKLLRLSGTVEELKQMLKELPESNNMLKMFIELDAVEENHDPDKIIELETLAAEFRNDSAEVLKYRIRFINQPAGTASLYDINVNIEDLKPVDVFDRKLENENLDEETSRLLREAFGELLEEVLQKEEEK